MYFSKYLKEMGHNPIVITVDEKYASYNQKDYSLLKEIDNIEIYKTKSFDLLKLYSFIKSGNTRFTRGVYEKNFKRNQMSLHSIEKPNPIWSRHNKKRINKVQITGVLGAITGELFCRVSLISDS